MPTLRRTLMDDKSVLDFQVEYQSLMSEDEEQRLYLSKTTPEELETMNSLKKEALLTNADFENDTYIEAMLKKIFRHQSVIDKFKVINGIPTITYSLSEKQGEKNKAANELLEIMREYDATFGTHYAEGAKKVKKIAKSEDYDDETEIDDSNYNTNINNRLARKGAQYQSGGRWLDLVIEVDRLLTGFDAPTIQALYVDKELKWHGLLQAFSRTNRVLRGKDIGMIVTFRKPWTMRKNVEDAFRLFSQEEREWEKLIPKEYKAVRKEFKAANKAFIEAQKELELDPNDPMKMMEAIKTFQSMQNISIAVKSYDEYNDELENDPDELTMINEAVTENMGHIENIKANLRELLPDKPPKEAFEIDFSPDQRATLEEKIDSYYIRQLLKDFSNESSRRKFYDAIKNKQPIVKMAYDEVLCALDYPAEYTKNTNGRLRVAEPGSAYTIMTDYPDLLEKHFRETINKIIKEASATLKVPEEDLLNSFNEYNSDKADVPYINLINSKSTLTKEEFELAFPGEMFRRRSVVREDYWRKKIAMLVPLKEELVNFGNTLKEF